MRAFIYRMDTHRISSNAPESPISLYESRHITPVSTDEALSQPLLVALAAIQG